MSETQFVTDDARAQILNTEVAKYVRQGYAVQSQGAGQAVLSRNKRIGWFWNTVLAFLTGGLWLIYVIYKIANRKQETLVITIDAHGNINRR